MNAYVIGIDPGRVLWGYFLAGPESEMAAGLGPTLNWTGPHLSAVGSLDVWFHRELMNRWGGEELYLGVEAQRLGRRTVLQASMVLYTLGYVLNLRPWLIYPKASKAKRHQELPERWREFLKASWTGKELETLLDAAWVCLERSADI